MIKRNLIYYTKYELNYRLYINMSYNDILREKLKYLIEMNYLTLEKFQIALNGSGDFSEITNLGNEFKSPFKFDSELGKNFERRLNQIMEFWMKLSMPQASFDMIGLSFKMIINSFLGDNIYKKVENWYQTNSKNPDTKRPDFKSLYSISNEDHDLIGTMTIVLFSGIIEDFVNNVKEDIIEELKIQISKNHYKKLTIPKRINYLLTELKIYELGLSNEVLDKLNYLLNELDDFRKIRNKIAHQGIQEMFLDMKDHVTKLSSYLEKLMEPQIKEQSKLISQKEGIFPVIRRFIPLLSYIFILYYRFLPILNLFDFYYNLKLELRKNHV